MAENKTDLTWLKFGCLGCLGVIAVIALAGTGIGIGAWNRAKSMENERRVITQDLPPAPGIPLSEEAGAEGSVLLLPPAGIAAGGQVILDLSDGNFRIEAAGAGEPLRLEAEYDPDSYELVEEFEPGEGSRWVYRVSFRSKGSSFLQAIAEIFSDASPEIAIYLPAEMPIELTSQLTEGGLEMNIGGLWLTSADLQFRRGGLVLEVDEPMRVPMERLSIRGSMGGLATAALGNASPRVLEVELRMGGMSLDLEGAWRNDSEITVGTSMGGGAMHLPDGLVIEGLDGETGRPQNPEVPLPVLRFTAASRLEDIEIR